jgi:hypothetical protein
VTEVVVAHTPDQDFRQDSPEIGGHGEVRRVEELSRREPRPGSVDATGGVARQHKHDVAMAVIAAIVVVFVKAAAALALHPRGQPLTVVRGPRTVEIGVESREAPGQGPQQAGKISAGTIALVVVGVPSTKIDGGHSET